jgi:hypothetical protein
VQLAPFFTAARAVDQRLHAAAARINGGIDATTIRIDQQTVHAVTTADPEIAARAIPAGLPDPLLQAVLLVYSDLSSRRAAFNRASQVKVVWGTSDEGADFMRCLRNGAQAAAHFVDDLAAAERLAAATPVIAVASPASRATANLTLLRERIDLANNGCGSCGGSRETELPTVEWGRLPGTSAPGVPAADGKIGGVLFNATYTDEAGWTVTLRAC